MSCLLRCNHCMTLFMEQVGEAITKCRTCGKNDALIEAPHIETAPVAPPSKIGARARAWRVFERRFLPIAKADGSFIWEKWEIPKDADYREWWTVVDPMTSSGRWYLAAGFHLVNRVGFVRCAVPWGGEWEEHPEYVYY